MNFQHYGPVEDAFTRSTSPDFTAKSSNGGFWWGVLVATVIFGFIAVVASGDYKIIRIDKLPNDPGSPEITT